MLNLLKSDFYKLGKARYFWVCLILTMTLAAGTVFLMDFTYKMAGEQMAQQVEQKQQAMDENGINVTTQGVPASREELSASRQIVAFFAGNTTLILAVLISLFVGSEFNHGTIKNIASKNYSRSQIYASKLAAGVLCGILFTFIYAAVSMATATILWGFGNVAAGFWPDALKSVGLELLLTCAFVSIFVMFSMLIRQNGGSLAANICFLEFVSLIVMLGEMLVKKISGKEIILSNYLIDTNMNAIAAGLNKTIAVRSLSVAFGFFLAAMLIGMLSFQKRDIK